MEILELLLIIIGLGAVILSFKLSDRSHSQEDSVSDETGAAVRQIKETGREWEEKLSQRKEDILVETESQLNTLSNENIMGISEYSGQVIDKIEKNHGEVVFLYHMLNEKEEEIKKLIHHIDLVKAQIHDKTAQEYQDASEAEASRMTAVYDQEIARIVKEEQNEETSDPIKLPSEEQKEPVEKEETAPLLFDHAAATNDNHNEEILSLYQQGHSILEISRMLSLGQGEVKFVIDLQKQK